MTRERHILICDDSIQEIRILVSMLRGMLYNISVATNGRDACTRASVLKLDLIVLDVKMPVMDGFAVCRLLRERRMQQACEWLSNTQMSINTIAANLGFTTGGIFATAFREGIQMPPRTYQQEMSRMDFSRLPSEPDTEPSHGLTSSNPSRR